MRIFFVSDTHFGHENVIKYENRPYNSVEEMDEDLILRWNKTVRDDDIVWFLGDLTLKRDKEYIKNLVTRLRGHKRIILGNHDTLPVRFYYEAGFDFVSRFPVVFHEHFILSHEPLPEMEYDTNHFYIYGHVHGHPSYKTATNNSRCVCVERTNYKPTRIEEVDAYQKEGRDVFLEKLKFASTHKE